MGDNLKFSELLKDVISKISTQTVIKIGIGLGIGYTIIRGTPLIKRRIVSNKLDDEMDINDTRGKPVIDQEWTYKSRQRSTDVLEASCVPIKPLSYRASTINQPSVDRDDILDVLIIGGAAAGLSTAACCKKQGLNYLVIEKNENVGDIWLSRYHRLHLHDIVDQCHLPEMDMPTSYPVFPNRKKLLHILKVCSLNIYMYTFLRIQYTINIRI